MRNKLIASLYISEMLTLLLKNGSIIVQMKVIIHSCSHIFYGDDIKYGFYFY